jgi:hypothetical protein
MLGPVTLRVSSGEAILQHLCALNYLPAAWDGHHAVVPACSMQEWFSTYGRVGGRFVYLDTNVLLWGLTPIAGRIDEFENTVYLTVLLWAVHAMIVGWNEKCFSQWRRAAFSDRSEEVPGSHLGHLCYSAWSFHRSSQSLNTNAELLQSRKSCFHIMRRL